jgi:hypothetical protein
MGRRVTAFCTGIAFFAQKAEASGTGGECVGIRPPAPFAPSEWPH